MSEKYIRINKNSYTIFKNSRNYGKFQNLEDAVFLRDELIINDWDLSKIHEVYHINEYYLIVKVIDDKLHLLGKYLKKPSSKTIDKLYKKRLRNPNNSKYGLNISRYFDIFIIQKQIMADEYIFGYYDNLKDAEFVRNHLMDHNWDVNSFSKIMFDEDEGNYKIIEVIDDKVYVIDSYDSEGEIRLDKSYEKFLSKISKHKLGLANHPYLDELTERIGELEELFNVEVSDEYWTLKDSEDPLDIIFKLTPFQKLVYDNIDDNTGIEDIEKSLQRFKSKNFKSKIEKNIQELIDLNLIFKNGDGYNKR